MAAIHPWTAGELAPFDARAAERQIAGVSNALLLRLDQLAAVSKARQRLPGTLVVEMTTTLSILDDRSHHGAMGERLARLFLLFTTSLQDVYTE